MAEKHQVQFLNFICRFGDDLKLLDMLHEVVLPAFHTKEARSFSTTKYFFHKVRVVKLEGGNDPVYGICGRFIKDTVLKREQVYDDSGELIQDYDTLKSSPSALFCLILNNHKLLYLNETSHAPSAGNFAATTQHFLKKSWTAYVNALHKKPTLDESGNKVTKKNLREKFPPPNLEVVPLSSDATLRQFIDRFEFLKTVEVVLVDTNDEVDFDDFFKHAREIKDSMRAKETKLTHTASKNVSLDSEEAYDQINSVSNAGQARIELNGKDKFGDKLKGNNDSFKLKRELEEIHEDPSLMAKDMYHAYQELVATGNLKPAQIADASDKLRGLDEWL
jgi:hypothetical protein